MKLYIGFILTVLIWTVFGQVQGQLPPLEGRPNVLRPTKPQIEDRFCNIFICIDEALSVKYKRNTAFVVQLLQAHI